MSRVNSNYERKERDAYQTPPWAIECLIEHLPAYARKIWEPACGEGSVVRMLADCGYDVYATDIVDGEDFFTVWQDPYASQKIDACDGIVTNPPYGSADRFIATALDLMRPKGFVALLLSSDFDSAMSRRKFFADCPIFAKTIVLTRRIVWFERKDGKKAAPSENHRWFIWDWRHSGPPTTGYAP